MPKILEEYAGEDDEYKKTDNPRIFYDWISEAFEIFVDDKTDVIVYGGNRGYWTDKIAELAEKIENGQKN